MEYHEILLMGATMKNLGLPLEFMYSPKSTPIWMKPPRTNAREWPFIEVGPNECWRQTPRVVIAIVFNHGKIQPTTKLYFEVFQIIHNLPVVDSIWGCKLVQGPSPHLTYTINHLHLEIMWGYFWNTSTCTCQKPPHTWLVLRSEVMENGSQHSKGHIIWVVRVARWKSWWRQG